MQQAFLHGSIVENPKTGLFITTNNFSIAPNIIRMYEEKAKNSKKPRLEHANCLVFLRNAIPILFSFQETPKAKLLFDEYQKLRNIKIDMRGFYSIQIKRLHEKGAARYQQSLIEISLFSAYRLLLDDKQTEALNVINYAEKEWGKHQQRYGNTSLKLPPFENLKAAAFCKAFIFVKNKKQQELLFKFAGNKKSDKFYIKNVKHLEFNGLPLREKITIKH